MGIEEFNRLNLLKGGGDGIDPPVVSDPADFPDNAEDGDIGLLEAPDPNGNDSGRVFVYDGQTWSEWEGEQKGGFPTNAWAVGDNTSFRRTLKSTGQTWNSINLETMGTPLTDFHFVDSSNGWAATNENNRLAKTTDGGESWSIINTNYAITNVFFVDSSEGWMTTDSEIYHSTDGGASWTSQFTTETTITSIQFVDASNGFVSLLGGTFLSTGNGGDSWDSFSPTSNDIHVVEFVDSSTGWIGDSGGQILKTTDSGSSWTTQFTASTGSGNNDIWDIDFVSSDEGWAVGQGGIYHATNGGSSWSQPGVANWTDSSDTSLGVSFGSSSYGWVYNSETNEIQYTTDGGASWDSYSFYRSFPNDSYPFLRGSRNIQFLDSSTGWIISSPFEPVVRLGKTTSGGDSAGSWNDYAIAHRPGQTFQEIELLGEGEGVFAGRNGGSGVIITFNNDGDNRNFQAVNQGDTVNNTNTLLDDNPIFAMHFNDSQEGWLGAAGSGYGVLYTSDGGQTWEQLSSLSSKIFDLHFVDSTEGFAITWNGVQHTTDGGSSWSSISSPISNTPRGIYFENSDNGWAIANNQIYYTSDGGSNWEDRSPSFYFASFSFGKPDFALGGSTAIIPARYAAEYYLTKDTGQSWQYIRTISTSPKSVDFVNPYEYWLSGYGTEHSLGYDSPYVYKTSSPLLRDIAGQG